jgi:hypothetical protein
MEQKEIVVGMFGYVQRSNRYHWRVDGAINYSQGFKSRQNCEEWLKERSATNKHIVDWRVDFLVKFKGLGTAWELVDKYGKKVYYK